MPQRRFSDKDDRMAEHVADSYPDKSDQEAMSIGYATAQARKNEKKKKRRKSKKPWPKEE